MTVLPDLRKLVQPDQTPMQEMEANTRKFSRRWFLWVKRSWSWPMWCCRLGGHYYGSERGIRHAAGACAEFCHNPGALLVAFTALTPVIAALAVSFGALNISLLPVIGIIAGVAAAIAGIIAIVKNWGAITEWFGNLWQSVFQKLMELWNGLVVFFTETIPAAFQTFIGFFFCHPGLVERPVVTGIRIFHEYLERDPAESHCPAGSDNDYFFVGEREKYPAGHLVGDL